MIALVDYGAGNLYSLSNSLKALSLEFVVTSSGAGIENADSVILPGVGAFGDAMKKLSERSLIEPIKRFAATGKPLLGICLGMQLLFSKGYEFGEREGLGLIPGEVKLIEAPGLQVPHMGWNEAAVKNKCELTRGLNGGEWLYFVHSYRAFTEERYISISCDYGGEIPALVMNGSVYGAQFHPEKSSKTGLMILKNFSEL